MSVSNISLQISPNYIIWVILHIDKGSFMNSEFLFYYRPCYGFAVVAFLISTLFSNANVNAQPSMVNGLFTQEIIPESPINDTCSVSTSEIRYPYTQLHAGLFHPTQKTSLPPVSQTIQILCSAPVSNAFLRVDSDIQSSSVSGNDPTHFGLGFVNGQGQLGYYQVKLDDAQVDEKSSLLYQARESSSIGQASAEVILHSTLLHGWAQNNHTPMSGQRFSVRMTIIPTLNSLKETNGPLVNGAELNGELVLSFPFGI